MSLNNYNSVPLEHHSQRTDSCQRHPLSEPNTISSNSSHATANGEQFLKDISQKLERIEIWRDNEIRKLMKYVESFMGDLFQDNPNPLSQDLASKANDLLEQLRARLDRPVLHQEEMFGAQSRRAEACVRLDRPVLHQEEMFGVQSRAEACVRLDRPVLHQEEIFRAQSRAEAFGNDSTMIPVGSADVNLMPGCSHPKNSGPPPLEATKQNAAGQNDSRNLCLLLLGSTGNGKSSLGNSILGEAVFPTSSSVNSSTPNIAMGSIQVGDQNITVVDGPSVHNSVGDDHDFMERIASGVEKSLDLCGYAFSAIVIVLKFGTRFTKQEVDTIKLIKSVLGKDVIRDYGICAVTYGDNFELAVEEAAEDEQLLTFESWYREQTGEVKTLFEECSFRCVLFDNRTKDLNKKSNQRQALLNMVNPMKTYSKEEFLHAEEGLKEVLATKELIPNLELQTQLLIDDTSRDMKMASGDDPFQYNSRMNSLLQKLNNHQEMLEELGLDSPKLSQLLLSLTVLQSEIRSKLGQRRVMEDSKRQITTLARGIVPSTLDLPNSDIQGYDHYSFDYINFPASEFGTLHSTTRSFNDQYNQQYNVTISASMTRKWKRFYRGLRLLTANAYNYLTNTKNTVV